MTHKVREYCGSDVPTDSSVRFLSPYCPSCRAHETYYLFRALFTVAVGRQHSYRRLRGTQYR